MSFKEVKMSKFKVGDEVYIIGHGSAVRRIRDVRDGEYLVWGHYKYISEDRLSKTFVSKDKEDE